MLYIYPEDRNSLRGDCTEELIKQLNSHNNIQRDDIIKYAIGICGRYHYSSSSTVTELISAYNKLIDGLATVAKEEFSSAQWTSLIVSLSRDNSVPVKVFNGFVETTDASIATRLSVVKRPAEPDRAIKDLVCSHNRKKLLDTGICDSILELIWSEGYINSCVTALTKCSSVSEVDMVSVEMVKLTRDIVEICLSSRRQIKTVLLEKLLATCLVSLHSFLVRKDLEADLKGLLGDLKDMYATLIMFVMPGELDPEFAKSLQKYLVMSVETLHNSVELVAAVEVLLKSLPWIPSQNLSPLFLWQSNSKLLSLIDAINEENQATVVENKEESKEEEPTVALASPEDDEDLHSPKNWLDAILANVPMDLDRQEEAKRVREQFTNKVRRLACPMLRTLASPSLKITAECCPVMLDVFRKLASASAQRSEFKINQEVDDAVGSITFKQEVFPFLKSIIEIELSRASSFVHHTCRYVLMCSGDMQPALAALIIKFYQDRLKSDADKTELTVQEWSLCIYARCFMNESDIYNSISQHLKAHFQPRSPELSAQDPETNEGDNQCIVAIGLLHVLFVGGDFLYHLVPTIKDFDMRVNTRERNRIFVPSVDKLDCELDLITIAVLNHACRFSLMEERNRDSSIYDEEQRRHFTPLLFPVITPEILSSSDSIVCIIYRSYLINTLTAISNSKFLFTTDKEYFIKIASAILNASPALAADLDKFTSVEKTLEDVTQLLNCCSNDMDIGKKCGIAALTAVSVAIDLRQIPITNELVESYRNFIKAFDFYETQSASATWGVNVGVDRLHCLMRVYRNTLICDLPYFQKHITDVLDRQSANYIRDETIKIPEPEPSDMLPLYSVDNPNEHPFKVIMAKFNEYFYTKCSSMEYADVPDEVFKWAVEVSSMARSSKLEADNARTILMKLGSNRAFRLNLLYILDFLVVGANCSHPIQENQTKASMTSLFFSNTLEAFLCSSAFDEIPWNESMFSYISSFLKDCGCGNSDVPKANGRKLLSTVFVRCLSNVIQQASNSNVRDSISTIFADNFGNFHNWIAHSACSVALLADFAPILANLKSKNLVDAETLSSQLSLSCSYILSDNVVSQLHAFFPLEIQKSDRFDKLLFHFRGCQKVGKRVGVFDPVPLAENRMIFNEAMQILCQYGDANTLSTLFQFIPKSLKTNLEFTERELLIINAEWKLQEDDERLIFHLMVLNGILCLVREVAELPNPANKFFADDLETAKTIVSRARFQMGQPTVTRRSSEIHKQGSTESKLCTYVTTERQFSQQHWYNCYTCKMVETVGMCSVCAINCHRGHDISYSKYGSFFCDCGAKGCSSLSSAPHTCSAFDASRGKVILDDSATDISEIEVSKHIYEISPEQVNWSDFEACMQHLCDLFSTLKEDLTNVLNACVSAHNIIWNVDKKREDTIQSLTKLDSSKISYSKTIMTELQEDDGVLNLRNLVARRTTEANMERERGRECSGIISLENGSHLWLLLDAVNLYIHHLPDSLSSSKSSYGRLDTEALSFNARRITCSGDKLAVVGRSDVQVFRFGRDGEIVDRMNIAISSELQTHTNPITKAVWAPGRTAVLAVATTQFVRIFDLTKDSRNHLEEVVLPVGNVEDLQLLNENGEIVIIVLSSANHLYRHQVTTTVPPSNSFYMTNNMTMPSFGVTENVISFYYSVTSKLLFTSFEKGVWVTHVNNGAIMEDNLTLDWKKLKIEQALYGWQEAGGIISALPFNQTQSLFYIYAGPNELVVQKHELTRRSPFSQTLFTPQSSDDIISIVTFYEQPSVMLLGLNWENRPDLWIPGLPVELTVNQPVSVCDNCDDLSKEDLVLCMERSEKIDRIEGQCEDLKRFYEESDLFGRLVLIDKMPVTVLQIEKFSLRMQPVDQNMIVRCIRIQVPADKGPEAVELLSTRHSLATREARFFDIPLTRTDSTIIESSSICLDFFGNKDGPTSIISIALYGVPLREFGTPRFHVQKRNPLTLTNGFLLNIISTMAYQKDFAAEEENQKWIINSSAKLLSLVSSHHEVVRAASRLLRQVNTIGNAQYYRIKDTIFFSDLRKLIEEDRAIPPAILPHILHQFKTMMCTRVVIFNELMAEGLGESTVLIDYLFNQLARCQTDPVPLLEVFVALSFVLLSMNDENSAHITKVFLNVFTDPATCHLSCKFRMLALTQIFSFSASSRSDRELSRTSSSHLMLMKWGGLRPFFQKTRIVALESPESQQELEQLMGPFITSEAFNKTESFDAEAEFLKKLLYEVLEKIKNEGHKNSMPKAGHYVGRHSNIPAHELMRFSILLLGQLYPLVLLPAVKHLIDMIDWKRPMIDRTEHSYTQQLLVHVLSVIITKCVEHADIKRRNKDRKRGSAGSTSDIGVALEVQTSVMEGEDAVLVTTEPDITSDQPTGDTETVKTHKKRSTEKMLYEIVDYLLQTDCLNYCYTLLNGLQNYWRTTGTIDRHTVTMKLWPPDTTTAHMSDDLFSLQSKHGSVDSLEYFFTTVTEYCLKLPYLMKKIKPDMQLSEQWESLVCEFIVPQFHSPSSAIRRQSKKLIVAMSNGDRKLYRMKRDRFSLNNNIELLRRKYTQCKRVFTHQQLTEMVEIVANLSKTANEHRDMWRQICEEQLEWLLVIACHVDDPVSGNIVELIVTAIREEPADQESAVGLADKLIGEELNFQMLMMLLMRYLIGRDESRRWLMHGMVRSTIQLASRKNQVTLITTMWSELWSFSKGMGAHGAQLADILAAYTPRYLPLTDRQNICQQELDEVKILAERLVREGHDGAYRMYMGLGLGWKALLMVNSPCLNCYNRQESLDVVKLNSIKQDTRFSGTTMMVKLVGHYEISKVIVKLTDVKKTKIVRKVNLHHYPKAIESPVELKTHREEWNKAGFATSSSGEGEISISLAIPICTQSLIIDFAEIIETRNNNDLHCPRCQSVVQPNPGICENCGENAFQCVKCRSINYDDKDPFLCSSCGHSKYAKVEVSVLCRPLPGVQRITTDAERATAMDQMTRLLSEMETVRSQVDNGRNYCEALWMRERPLPPFEYHSESATTNEYLQAAIPPMSPNQHPVHGVVVAINVCKAAYEELCSQTMQLLTFREELRRYDRSTDSAAPGHSVLHKAIKMGFYSTSKQCFGCICARIMHSFVILQGLAADEGCRQIILENKMQYQKLVSLGLRYEPLVKDTEAFIYQMAYDNELGTQRLCELVDEGIVSPSRLSKSILDYHDDKWQCKLKALIKHCVGSTDEQVHLSCLQTIYRLLEDGRSVRNRIFKKIHGLTTEYRSVGIIDEAAKPRRIPVANSVFGETSLFGDWLLDKQKFWSEGKGKQEYVYDPAKNTASVKLVKEADSFLWRSFFSNWTSISASACQILTNIATQPGHAGIAVSLVWSGLQVADQYPSKMTDHFFRSVHDILSKSVHIKVRMYMKSIHMWLMNQIYKECKRMNEEECKEISVDHQYGTILRRYVETVNLIFSGDSVESTLLKGAADHILLPLLQATIFLKRVVLRRTSSVDASRSALERLVKRVSFKEPLILLQAAVQSLDSSLDFYTQAQIVSVILEVVDPEKQKDEEFNVQIEKDPAQEDYLQGRMTGNPYKSSDPGIGPLMRDIKNKICTETEMVGLLDDDNGMELLIAGQIISLSLPVHDVYNKLWRPNHQGPMTIIYRMRGLSGDAVEPMVNTLGENETESSSEDASLNKLVDAFSRYGGLTRVLDIIAKCDMSTGGRLLLNHMKLLMERCVKSEQGRKKLVEAGAIRVFIKVVRDCVSKYSSDEGVLTIGLDYLTMMGTIIDDIETHPYLHHLTKEDAHWLLELAMKPTPAAVIRRIDGRINAMAASKTGSLILGSKESEEVLVEACRQSLDWNEIDSTTDVNLRSKKIHEAERIADIVSGIHSSEQGKQLKQKILDSGVLAEACQYLSLVHPPLLSATESPEWKGFLLRPSLKLMMNFMTNMAKGHEASQMVLAERTLPVLHRLEQIASDDSIGTLAENVMEALKENTAVAVKIESVRQETKQKKKQMAMAMRSKQLAKMGMRMGKQGEVKVTHRKVANEPALEEVSDPLAVCCICREAIFTGSKPAGAYSFGYSIGDVPSTSITTVSAMVLVHLECHQSAIRRGGGGRQADEWSKAQLHNAGAKCNVMTPLALHDVGADGFAVALARYQLDLDVIQRTSEINRAMIFTDMCHCIDRFVTNGSFSDRSNGGGRESNAQYLVILHLMALCLKEDELPTNDPRWRIYAFLLTEQSLEDWNSQRLDVLRAALDDACRSSGIRDWVVHRNLCLAWTFVDMYFRTVVMTSGDDRIEWMKSHLLEIIKRAPSFNTKYEAIGNHVGSFEEYAGFVDLPIDEFRDFFFENLEDDQIEDEGLDLDEEQDEEDEQEDEQIEENDQ